MTAQAREVSPANQHRYRENANRPIRTLPHIHGDVLPERNFTFQEFCERVTSHGIVDWYEARSTLAKIWWGLLILLTLAILIYQIVMEITEYYTGAIQTTISFSSLPLEGIKFPPIYICPLSFVNKYCVHNWTQFRETNGIYKQNSRSILDQTGSNWEVLASYNPPVLEPATTQAPKGQPVPPEIICGPKEKNEHDYLKYVAMAVPDYFVECKFNGQNVSCDCIAEPYLDKEYGVCYLVNVTKGDKVTHGFQTTDNLGLSLVLDVHKEYYPSAEDLNNMNVLQFFGAQVRAQNPIDPSTFGGTLVQAGTYARIKLTAEEINLIDIGYSTTPQHCVADGQRKMKFFNAAYSAELCRMDCTQVFLNETCKCVMPFDPEFILAESRNSRICSEHDFETCVTPKIKAPEKALNDCTCFCYDACHSWQYDMTVSELRIPKEPIKHINLRYYKDLVNVLCSAHGNSSSLTLQCPPLQANDTALSKSDQLNTPYSCPMSQQLMDDLKYHPDRERKFDENLIILDIAFSKLQYTQIQQSPPRTITTLLANIGGQAGLWMGASIFTIIQVIVFAAYFLYSKRGWSGQLRVRDSI